MLNIGKLRRGGENYYLNSVGRGVEDYYLGSGEAAGYWLASGAADLGLEGEVKDNHLRNILRGAAPSGGVFAKTHPNRVPGFDLTFLAPKSVALLHELGSKEASKEALKAHEAAVAAALGYLERHASGARRGKGGKRSIESNGFIGAAFRHRTSRSGDPLLHTHVLVANLIRGKDGKWGALDAKHLYRHAKTAGYLYQAHLRAEMTSRLGVDWSPVRKGAADIEGISREAIRAFSKRRAEVEAVLSERGATTGRQREVAALTTRQAKDYRVSPQRLLPDWQQKAQEVGLRQDVLEALLGERRVVDGTEDFAEIAARLAEPTGLTAQASAFSRRDVIQGFCSELPEGATVSEIERMADLFVSSEEIITLSGRLSSQGSDQGIHPAHLERSTVDFRYSTAEMLAVEKEVIERAIRPRAAAAGVVAPGAVSAAVQRRPGLFPDQRAMVERLTTSGLGVEVVVGKAGAGKTFALDAAREAWQLSGYQVWGCSLSARAAQELQLGSGIQSFTISRLLGDFAHPNHGGLHEKSVVVVDEAGMVGTRMLDRLLGHVERVGAKLVLVGDDRQLPEIDAGGAFAAIKNRLPVLELSEVKRQPDGWERHALDLLREGRSEEALAHYRKHGRVHVASSAEETRHQLVTDWWATQGDIRSGVMIAARRSDVSDLNRRAREMLREAGRLGDQELEVAGVFFSVGDSVMTLKNSRRLGVVNGTRAFVEAVDTEELSLSLRLESGSHVVVPRSYLEDGHLTHAYAITGHKAQGMTTDKAFVLGDETLYREWGYVAMSRGKQRNSLYVVASTDLDRQELGGEVDSVSDPTAELTRALGRSHAQELALDVYEKERIRTLPHDQNSSAERPKAKESSLQEDVDRQQHPQGRHEWGGRSSQKNEAPDREGELLERTREL